MKKKILFGIGIILLIGGVLYMVCREKEEVLEPTNVEYTSNFNIDLIKTTKRNVNYLISPYSIEIALNMLKEGANNNTRKEIDDLLPNRTIEDVSIANRVKIANALFIKEKHKNKVKKDFSNLLVKNYHSEMVYDKFTTPEVINNWVNVHTDGMIERILDDIDPDFVLGLANAVAIDVEWASPFECVSTTSEEFTMVNNEKMNVEMMHNSYTSSSYKYLKDEDATGIIIPYKKYNNKTGEYDEDSNTNLEFIGILPNTDVSTYIDNLTYEKLTSLLNSEKEASRQFEIQLSLPRFKYLYEIPNFKEVLESLGIKDAFDEDKADFTKIMATDDMENNLYVNDAIHKTYIDLNEKGTKAAAVTYFGMKFANAIMPDDKEIVNIEFNRPFIYMIEDSKTKEILFFGVVYTPNKWEGRTCENIEE